MPSHKKSWELKWKKVNGPIPGGQSNGYCVRLLEAADEKDYFLKELKKSNKKFKERMSVEVACYKILKFDGIPLYIDDNASQFESSACELYIVTEYIVGETLQQKAGLPSTIKAVACMLRLCQIVEYCHDKEVMHRDIKPSNIMLRNNKWEDPILVDFGLSFCNIFKDENIGSIPQEIGPRFLRLPEFAPHSSNKRNPISDVTLCAGIFLYLLTKIEPCLLVDDDGNLPHQRRNVREKLLTHHKALDILKLLTVFDQAFDPRIDYRFQTIKELSSSIKGLLIENREQNQMNIEEQKRKILEIVNSHKHRAVADIMANLNAFMNIIQKVIYELAEEFKDNNNRWIFSVKKTGFDSNPANQKIVYSFGFECSTDKTIQFLSKYEVQALGNEIIVLIDNEVIYRHNVNSILQENDFKEIIKQHNINKLDICINASIKD